MDLLGQDLLTATLWMDLRRKQDPKRAFGAAPTAAWTAFRQVVPFLGRPAGPKQPVGTFAVAFLKAHPADTYYPRKSDEP